MTTDQKTTQEVIQEIEDELEMMDPQANCPKCGVEYECILWDGFVGKDYIVLDCEICHHEWKEPLEITCCRCGKPAPTHSATPHDGQWYGECCYSKRNKPYKPEGSTIQDCITRVLTISTAHHSELDNELMDDNPDVATFLGEGHIVYVPQVGLDEYLETLKHYGFSKAFRNILEAAHKNQCTHVRFDCDATVLDGFPTYNW